MNTNNQTSWKAQAGSFSCLGLLLICLLLPSSLYAAVVTRYAYDEAGNQTTQVDALNRTNVYAYDSIGLRISHTLPGNQMERFVYDLGGNLVYTTNFNGVVITNRYDVLNRLTVSVTPSAFLTEPLQRQIHK